MRRGARDEADGLRRAHQRDQRRHDRGVLLALHERDVRSPRALMRSHPCQSASGAVRARVCVRACVCACVRVSECARVGRSYVWGARLGRGFAWKEGARSVHSSTIVRTCVCAVMQKPACVCAQA